MTFKIPESAGMLLAEAAELFGWIRGVPKEDCGLPKAHVLYVLSDMYFDIEKVRSSLVSSSLVVGRADSCTVSRQDECWDTSR